MRAKPLDVPDAGRLFKSVLAKLVFPAVAVFCTLYPEGMAASTVNVEVRSRPISTFSVNSSQTQFGKLEFLGGLILDSSEPLFGAISSIRVLVDGKSFIAVLDTGHWMRGEIVRNSDGILSGLAQVRIDPMLDEQGNEAARKSDMDAEGLALRGDRAFVSFEQIPRIEIFANGDLASARPLARLPHLIPDQEFRRNGGMETLALSPQDGPLQGALVTVAEASVDTRGNLFAAILEGPRKGRFFVANDASFSVTDGAFLDNGDLLLLERRFNLAEGVGMRVRKIPADTIKPGAVVDGPILMEADLSHQINNMEGIDVVKGADGITRLIITSDDNHSFLQRNIMLEFRLSE